MGIRLLFPYQTLHPLRQTLHCKYYGRAKSVSRSKNYKTSIYGRNPILLTPQTLDALIICNAYDGKFVMSYKVQINPNCVAP
jgi:hypothetical protein